MIGAHLPPFASLFNSSLLQWTRFSLRWSFFGPQMPSLPELTSGQAGACALQRETPTSAGLQIRQAVLTTELPTKRWVPSWKAATTFGLSSCAPISWLYWKLPVCAPHNFARLTLALALAANGIAATLQQGWQRGRGGGLVSHW